MPEFPSPTIVVLPGADGLQDVRRAFLTRIGRHYPVTILVPQEQSSGGYEGLINTYQARLPGGKLVLVGESMSGPAAIALAGRLGGRVMGLALVSSFPKLPWSASWVRAMTSLLWVPVPETAARLALFGTRAVSPQGRELLHELAALDRRLLTARLCALTQADSSTALSGLRCRVAIFHGRFDRLVWPSVARHNAAAGPDRQLFLYPAGHALMVEQPDALARDLAEFVRSLRATPSLASDLGG